MKLFILVFLFFILFALVLAYIIPIYKRHYKVTGDIINYDYLMRKFVYKVNLSRENIIGLLTANDDRDELSCSFDPEKSVIEFAEYGSSKKYYFNVQECQGFSIIGLEQVALIGTKSQIPFRLNPFFIRKLQAEIIPYSQYGLS